MLRTTTGLAPALLLLAAAAPGLGAQTCTVPGSHVTAQEAVDDPGCATVNLGAQTFAESVVINRSLTLSGPATGGAVIRGLVVVTGASTQVTLQDLRVENGCPPDALRVAGGARLDAENLEVERSAALPCPALPDLVFKDGFESGDLSAWSGPT